MSEAALATGIAIILLFFGGLIGFIFGGSKGIEAGFSSGVESVQDQAVEAGAGEYYLEGKEPKFRFITNEN